jgi:acetyl esterase/lipase
MTLSNAAVARIRLIAWCRKCSRRVEPDPAEMAARYGASLYLNAADPRSPLAAPIYADLTGLAPLLIQVGAAETLLDDAIRLARVAGAADMRVDLQIWPEMIHVWHRFHPELKAGQRGIEQGGAFVRAHTAEKLA